MSRRPDEIIPGTYDYDGTMAARLEQARADTIDQLRTATGMSVSLITGDGEEGTHFAIILSEDPERAPQFLCWALAKAWKDALEAIPNCDDDDLYEIVREMTGAA